MQQNKWYETGSRRGGVTLRCDVRPFVLSLTNQHVDQPGVWLGSCSGLFSNVKMGTPGKTEYAQDAQEELMNMVIGILQTSIDNLRDIRPLKVEP